MLIFVFINVELVQVCVTTVSYSMHYSGMFLEIQQEPLFFIIGFFILTL